MTKYIKDKNGKFAGSIGDGKNDVPNSAPSITSHAYTDAEISPGEAKALDDMFSRFQAARYAHHEKTIAAMSRVLSERFPGLTAWGISAEQRDRDYAPDVHLAYVKVEGETVYDRYSGEHSEFDLEEGNLDEELTAKLADMEDLATRLEDAPTIALLSRRRETVFVDDYDSVMMYHFGDNA